MIRFCLFPLLVEQEPTHRTTTRLEGSPLKSSAFTPPSQVHKQTLERNREIFLIGLQEIGVEVEQTGRKRSSSFRFVSLSSSFSPSLLPPYALLPDPPSFALIFCTVPKHHPSRNNEEGKKGKGQSWARSTLFCLSSSSLALLLPLPSCSPPHSLPLPPLLPPSPLTFDPPTTLPLLLVHHLLQALRVRLLTERI